MGWKSTLVGSALVAILAATGCNGGGGAKVATLDAGNGSSDQSSQSDGSTSSTSFEDALVAFAGCMRDHGIDMPDPTFQSTGSGDGGLAVTAAASGDGGPLVRPDSAEFKAADDACKPLLDAAMKDAPKPSAEELAAQTDKMLAFAKCMREHGIDMPDPVIGGDGAVQVQAGGPSSASDGAATMPGPDPAFEAAAKVCGPDSGIGFGTASAGHGAPGGAVVTKGSGN